MERTWLIAFFAIIAFVGFVLAGCTANLPENTNKNSGNANFDGGVKMDMYVMSQCPYGTQVVDAIALVKQELGPALELNIEFIANDNGDGTFTSLHGQPEVLGDIVQLCAMKHSPDKYLDMLTCQNKNAGAIPGNWEACAKDKGLDVSKIKSCFEGDEGKQLLSESIKKANSVGATASPTIYINGKAYSGGRTTNDFLRAVCSKFEEKPKECLSLPEPAKVNTVIINDKRCDECDISQLETQLELIFPGIVIKEIDYNDPQGKAFYIKLGLNALPAIIFDESVKEGEGYSSVQSYLVPVDKYYSLNIGANFDPTAEICDNSIDDTGNGKIDCEDETCKSKLICREEIPNSLQVFIMSDCPYGRKAIEALKGVKENFDGLNFKVHYIASETATGFSSLHGQYEVDENIIQLCTNKHSPEQWFDYLYCRSVKGVNGKDWKACAGETGVDINAVQSCFENGEGSSLLREDIKIAQSLRIGASPTWLANNKHTFGGIDAETVKINYCKYNDVAGCEKVLSSSTGSVQAGACG